jgi:hypothetical protein
VENPHELQDELNLLDPKGVQLYLDEFEDLVLEYKGERQTVRAVRAFPFTAETEFIVLRNEEGDEVGAVRKLSALDPASRAVLSAEMDKAYFRPEILQVYEIEENFHIPKFDVETDRGPRVFEIRSQRRDIRVMGNGRVLIRDADGNLYEIPDYRRMDPVSQALVESYI